MNWQIKGLESFSYITGNYNTEEALAVLQEAAERAQDWYEFDQMVEGQGVKTGLLSGSQLLAALAKSG